MLVPSSSFHLRWAPRVWRVYVWDLEAVLVSGDPGENAWLRKCSGMSLGADSAEGRSDKPVMSERVRNATLAKAVRLILISQRLQAALEDRLGTESVDGLQLKGFSKPVDAFRVIAVRS
jgi:hypothetical protein